MSGYLVYHPRRVITQFGPIVVHHDRPGGNEDPYVWNERFLHTYCHMTQMTPQEGMFIFWVSANRFPCFSHLVCDLVFVVDKKLYWRDKNRMEATDPMVDSERAFEDHYRWAEEQHRFKRRRRFTLKADPSRSFQPQTSSGTVIDVLPELQALGLRLGELRRRLGSTVGSRPCALTDAQASGLASWLESTADIRLTGAELARLRNPESGL